MVRKGKLEIVKVEIQASEDDADRRVERMASRDSGIIVRCYSAIERRVGAANVRNGFRVELGFYTGFAEDEDGALGWGERNNTRDVDCGAVRGAENFVLLEFRS